MPVREVPHVSAPRGYPEVAQEEIVERRHSRLGAAVNHRLPVAERVRREVLAGLGVEAASYPVRQVERDLCDSSGSSLAGVGARGLGRHAAIEPSRAAQASLLHPLDSAIPRGESDSVSDISPAP